MKRIALLIFCFFLAESFCLGQEAKVTWETLSKGDGGKAVQMGDTVNIEYQLNLTTGEHIDGTAEGKTFEMQVGSTNIIRGLSQGVIGMTRGETRKITVPYSLGYGTLTQGPIPGYSTLLFTVKLQSLEKSSSPSPSKAKVDPEHETSDQHQDHNDHEHETPEEHAGHDHSGSASDAPPQLARLMYRDFFSKPWSDPDGPKKIWRSNLWLSFISILVVLMGWIFHRKRLKDHPS